MVFKAAVASVSRRLSGSSSVNTQVCSRVNTLPVSLWELAPVSFEISSLMRIKNKAVMYFGFLVLSHEWNIRWLVMF